MTTLIKQEGNAGLGLHLMIIIYDIVFGYNNIRCRRSGPMVITTDNYYPTGNSSPPPNIGFVSPALFLVFIC